MTETPWKLFVGNGQSFPLRDDAIPEAPPWRCFMSQLEFDVTERELSLERWEHIAHQAGEDIRGQERGENFRLDTEQKGYTLLRLLVPS